MAKFLWFLSSRSLIAESVSKSGSWVIFCSIHLMLAILLVGCGSSSNDTKDGDTGTVSVFASSDATAQLFGTRTTRDLQPQVTDTQLDVLVSATNDFSLDLHRVIMQAQPGENSIESGYSAAAALTLLSAGADGVTYSSLVNLLHLDTLSESEIYAGINALALDLDTRANEKLILNTANRLFIAPGFTLSDDFLDVATGQFNAPVVAADFANKTDEVTALVNAWVSDQTDGFIPKIIGRFSPSTVFALLNAIFLDAGWQDDYENIGERDFTSANDTADSSAVARLPFFGGRSNLPVIDQPGLIGLEIPYGGNELAMLILMPDELQSFEQSLDATVLAQLVDSATSQDVSFEVPNWDDEADLNLVTLLEPIGLPGNPYNLSRMFAAGSTSLEILMKQRARIEVDENGTRAAAVTLIAGDDSLPRRIQINKPFVYILRDRTTGLVLFTGRVVAL